MWAQASSTKRVSAGRNAILSAVRSAEAVSTNAVANAGENSTLGADAMHAMLPIKQASSPGRGRWDATPCERDQGNWAVVARTAVEAIN